MYKNCMLLIEAYIEQTVVENMDMDQEKPALDWFEQIFITGSSLKWLEIYSTKWQKLMPTNLHGDRDTLAVIVVLCTKTVYEEVVQVIYPIVCDIYKFPFWI